MTGRKKKYKTSKIRSFLFFFLLALVFWVLTKFSEESDGIVYGNLSYINVPGSVSVSTSNVDNISFEVNGNGFQFLSYNVKPPEVAIDLSIYYQEGDSSVTISGAEVSKIISSQVDAKVNSTSVKDLNVALDLIVSKRVPVTLVQEISFAEGFKIVGTPVITPDSVSVSGPSADLETISEVFTEKLVKDNVSELIETKISISSLNNTNVSISEETVQLKIEVEEFTQKQLTIPVELINAPSDVTLKLVPENVVLSFDVSVSRFNSISANDFRIVCDFEGNSTEENILVPKLDMVPDGLYHIEWNTKRIEYLIFK